MNHGRLNHFQPLRFPLSNHALPKATPGAPCIQPEYLSCLANIHLWNVASKPFCFHNCKPRFQGFPIFQIISAYANGGPRSQVCARKTLCSEKEWGHSWRNGPVTLDKLCGAILMWAVTTKLKILHHASLNFQEVKNGYVFLRQGKLATKQRKFYDVINYLGNSPKSVTVNMFLNQYKSNNFEIY